MSLADIWQQIIGFVAGLLLAVVPGLQPSLPVTNGSIQLPTQSIATTATASTTQILKAKPYPSSQQPIALISSSTSLPTNPPVVVTNYQVPSLGISLSLPVQLQMQTNSRGEIPPGYDGCVEFINKSGVNDEIGDDGAWFTICKTQTPVFSETGYWGDTIRYYFDATTNSWMYSSTGSDMMGGATPTTTASIVGHTLSGEPIFAGTGQHSFVDRIVPLSSTTFLDVTDDYFGDDWAPDSLLDRIVQTLDDLNYVASTTASQQAIQNEVDAYNSLNTN